MDLIRINYDSEVPTVSARQLHEGLEINTRFNDWYKRMCEYGFAENVDYQAITQKRVTAQGNETTFMDYQISIDMAKQICMIQRTDKGKQYRQYFIDLEKAWNTPEQVMARALKIANNEIDKLKAENKVLIADTERMKLLADTNRAILYRAESFADMISYIERTETCRKEVQA